MVISIPFSKERPFFLKRRKVTLIEVLISISLLSILLFALLSSYADIKGVDALVVKENKKGQSARILESRLEAILLQIPNVEEGRNFFFTDNPAFSASPSLVFTYNNHFKIDPKFSSMVLGRLFVDQENRLILATWPAPEKDQQPSMIPMRLEVLEENVKNISFAFYVPPKKNTIIDSKTIDNEGNLEPDPNRWHLDWKKNYGILPPLIRLHLLKEDLREVDFSFYLANNQYPLEIL